MSASTGFATLGCMAMVACAYCCGAATELMMLFVLVVHVSCCHRLCAVRSANALHAVEQADSRHGFLRCRSYLHGASAHGLVMCYWLASALSHCEYAGNTSKFFDAHALPLQESLQNEHNFGHIAVSLG